MQQINVFVYQQYNKHIKSFWGLYLQEIYKHPDEMHNKLLNALEH